MLNIHRIDHVALTSRDIDAAAALYTQIGFEVVLRLPRATFLRHGEAVVALFPAREDARDGKGRGAVDNSTVAIQHVAFRVAEGSLEELKSRLETLGIAVRGPIDHEINRSIYFEDADGHQLELTHPI